MRLFNQILLIGTAAATEECEKCSGKGSVQCDEMEKKVTNGTYRTNCDKKCKIWECAACDVCEDTYETCTDGFRTAFNESFECDCGATGTAYGCECVPCESTGPNECGDDMYMTKESFGDECSPSNKCWAKECNQCEECSTEMPICDKGSYLAGVNYTTKDCGKDCTKHECTDCEGYCPIAEQCGDGLILETMECTDGDYSCDECNCDHHMCRACVPCEDQMADCPWYETAVSTGHVYGECNDDCEVYSCVCAAPCSDEVIPSCAPEDKLKSWTFDDDCGNTCKQYECKSYDPLVHLEGFIMDMEDTVAALFGDAKPKWQLRIIDSFISITEKAKTDYEKKNPVCHFYGEWELPVEEDEVDVSDSVRELPEACHEDARAIRQVSRHLRSWCSKYTTPCGDNEGNDAVYFNKLNTKINKWRQQVIKKRCKMLEA